METAESAPHAERVRGADGLEYWKLTCFCGKHLLAPFIGGHTHGRCTQCGRRLRLPSERPITGGPLPVIPARRAPRRIRDLKSKIAPVDDAQGNAADKLRPKGASSERRAKGLISAWPAASLPRRALAFFVDSTFLMVFVTAVCLAAGPGKQGVVLPIVALLMAWFFNDAYLQSARGGSLGKLIALVLVRNEEGERLTPEKVWMRSLAKLVLLPAFPLIFADEEHRAAHDRVMHTRVLLGRAHGQFS